ncbi:MAG: hypothetical protein JSV61_13600 [Anaerolineales bacterium]|nr:MAG: hypothetical protein JSV61_13600 [Anaerolineales bacterium]
MHTLRLRPLTTTILLLLMLATLVSACDSGIDNAHEGMELYPLDKMPAEVQAAPVTVQQAYQFAAANPEALTEIPCYCGCGAMGHTSNYACYVSGQEADGSVIFDTHALGCSICVDITLDTMRMMKEGKSIPQIKSFVDETYAKYGPSNMP